MDMKPRVIWITLGLALGFAFAGGLLVGGFSLQRPDKLFFQVDLSSSVDGNVQLFFDIGHLYNLNDSAAHQVSRNRREHLQFALPSGKIFGLRFDPIDNPAEVTIDGPMIVDSNGAVVHRFNLADFTPVQHIKSLKAEGNAIGIACTEGGSDPYLFISVPPSLAKPFVIRDWLRATIPPTSWLFLLISGLSSAAYIWGGAVYSRISIFISRRPLLTLAIVSSLAVILQFYPLFFSIASKATDSMSVVGVSATVSGSVGGQLQPSTPPSLSWINIFALLPKLFPGQHWTQTLGILWGWWIYVFGCAVLAWRITRSLGVATVIGGCALFSHVWGAAALPSTVPALVIAPWAFLAWIALGTLPKSLPLFLLAGTAILTANLEMVAVECSLRVATLATAIAAAGVLFIAMLHQPVFTRALRTVVGLASFIIFAVLVAFIFWRKILLPGDGTPEAAKTVFQVVPASAGLALFEGFFSPNRETYPFPSTTLVVLAGLAWAFSRSDETFRKPGFIAIALVIAPLALLGAGVLPNEILGAWFKQASTARFQEAAWYSLVFFLGLLASFGFAELRQFWATPGLIYKIKAALIFFAVFAVYFGTFENHAAFTNKTAYLISAIVMWGVVHVAMAQLPSVPESRIAVVFVTGALLLIWWQHTSYAQLLPRFVWSAS